ncbi:MAG: hypothetical protein LJE66_09860 [Desulfobacterales bacterium]|jgi:hypothetical protein|nr:hypothetical protein [Desulfobacterales bacterium]
MTTKTFSAMMLVMMITIPVFGYGENYQNVVEQKEKGSINWTRGVIEAKGIGIPPERRIQGWWSMPEDWALGR